MNFLLMYFFSSVVIHTTQVVMEELLYMLIYISTKLVVFRWIIHILTRAIMMSRAVVNRMQMILRFVLLFLFAFFYMWYFIGWCWFYHIRLPLPIFITWRMKCPCKIMSCTTAHYPYVLMRPRGRLIHMALWRPVEQM